MAITVFRSTGYIGADRQTVQGTPVAPTKFFKPKKQQFVIDQALEEIRNGNTRDINNLVKLWVHGKGAFQTYMYVDEFAFLLSHAMGKDTISGAGDPYSHALTLLDALPFSSFETAFAENQLLVRWTDCKINTLTVSAKVAELALVDVDLQGSTTSVPTAATPTFSDGITEGPMVFHQGVFTLTGPTDAAVVNAQVQEVTVVLDNGLQFVMGPNSIVPIYQLETVRKITVKFTAAFSGPNLYQLTYLGANAGTVPSSVTGTGSLTLKFTSAASPEHSVLLTFPQFAFTDAKPMYDPTAKLATMAVEATAYRSGATLPMTATVKNAISVQYTA